MAISLRTRILSVSVLAIALTTGYLVIENSLSMTKQMRTALLNNARNFAGAYGEDVGHWLKVRQTIMSSLARFIEENPDTSAYPAILQAHRSGSFGLTYYGNEQGEMFRQDPSLDINRDDNYDPRVRGWYKLAKAEQQPAITPAYVSATLQELVVTLVDPVKRNGKFAGSVGANLTLGQLSKQISALTVPGSGRAMIIDNDNNVIAYADQDWIMKKASELSSDLEPQVLHRLIRENRLDEYSIDENTYFAYAQAIPDTPDWSLVFLMDRDELMSPVYKTITRQLIVAVVILLVFTALLYTLFRVMFRDLERVAHALDGISRGEGDLTSRIDIKHHDEIGLLADGFNRFVEHMHGVVTRLKRTSEQLAHEAQNMSSSSEQRAQRVIKQQDEIDMVASAVTEMAAATQEIAGNAESTATAAEHSVDLGHNGRRQVEQSRDSTRSLANEVGSAGENISALDEHAQKISGILSTISDIAEQTNLLALNAAIEAARAGEHGRGFAVVADEVRSLSQRTHTATGEIQDMIEALQKRTAEAVEVMQRSQTMADTSVHDANEATESLVQIADAINSISSMATQIAAAAEEQTSVTQDINSNTETIRLVSSELAEEIQEGVQQAERLNNLARSVDEEVGRFKT
ncbi:hypothetical protein BFW38_07825 [Terasakiispira papahanaumokuakeensis]|uniref:Chemotaxis protein n=1 Tax=Terasakiispira papahanaumokuakeensis TaxID=197479 RepID=A0A1E2V915_9GAMM|nr:methyl-accepting chemotaxis protein [Terasakiispira papahanaumokuakeensis]ODC03467.1 hypothetical protein BFW38_07825 [Terasakiispira papahanaumokuakeensis]